MSAVLAGVLLCVAGACRAERPPRVLERDPAIGGPPMIALDMGETYFEDADLRAAVAQLDEGNPGAAIEAFGRWLRDNPQSSRASVARFVYGLALYEEGSWESAETQLERCAAELAPLADHCLYLAASAAFERGVLSEAAVLAASVDRASTFGPRAWFLSGRVLLAEGDFNAAAEALSAFNQRYPDAWYSASVRFELAEALIGSGEYDSAAAILRALESENRGRSDGRRAHERLDQIETYLSEAVHDEVDEDRITAALRSARADFDRHRSEQVISTLEPVVLDLDMDDPSACEARYLIGKSYSKLRRHDEASGWYDSIVDNCADSDLRVKALYNGGRAHWNADRDDVAVMRFQRIWVEYAHHSYADDAVLYAARVHRGNGDNDAMRDLLRLQVERFPDGDMLKDAVWLQMADLVRAEDWRGAIAFVDEVGSRTGENDIYSRGRLDYFRARALESLSLTTEAVSAYEAIFRAYPLSWYSLMATHRLMSLSPDSIAVLVQEAQAANAERSDRLMLPADVATDDDLRAGILLVRVGLIEQAKLRLNRARARYENLPAVGAAISALLNDAELWHLSHRVPSERLQLAEGWPAAGTRDEWEVAYPMPFARPVRRFAAERDLDPAMVYAVMREESGFSPGVESWANARGLMQLMIGTARDMGELTGRRRVSESDLFDPEINIELGTMFLRRLGDRFDMHPLCMIAGYNGGAGNVRSWLRENGELPLDLWVEEIPYAQTRHYAKRVAMSWWAYRWLYSDEPVPRLPSSLPDAD